jgi:hypothetical protein
MAWIPAAVSADGAIAGAVSGGKGQKTPGTPKFVKRQVRRGFHSLNDAANRPVGEAISPLNADQNRAFDMIRGNVGLGAADTATALSAARRAAGGVNAGDISSFYNPYEDSVVGNTINDLSRARDINLLGINSAAEAAGAFGGDRAVLARALASEDFNRNIAQSVAGLRYNGYNAATDSAFRNNSALVSGAGSLLDAVGTQRGDAYQDAGAVMGVGDQLRAYQQSLLDYPLQMAQLKLNAGTSAMGVQSGTTTGGGVAGAMAGAAGGLNFARDLYSSFKKT